MKYGEMSNEELRQALREKFPRVNFKEVTEDNREAFIAVLKIEDGKVRRPEDV